MIKIIAVQVMFVSHAFTNALVGSSVFCQFASAQSYCFVLLYY